MRAQDRNRRHHFDGLRWIELAGGSGRRRSVRVAPPLRCGRSRRHAGQAGGCHGRSRRAARGGRPTSSASAGGGRSAARWRGHRKCNENFTTAAVVARASLLPVAFLGLLRSPSDLDVHPHLRFLRSSRGLNAEAQLATAAATIAHAMMRMYNFPSGNRLADARQHGPRGRRAPAGLAPQRLHGRRATVCRSRMVTDRRTFSRMIARPAPA